VDVLESIYRTKRKLAKMLKTNADNCPPIGASERVALPLRGLEVGDVDEPVPVGLGGARGVVGA